MSSYGAKWPPYPAGPLYVDSQDVYANPEAPLTVIGSGGGGGVVPADLNVSTLKVAGNGQQLGITMLTNPSLSGQSVQILFNNAGQDDVDSGQLAMSKDYWPGVNGSTIRGLGVFANSTIFGSYQPVCCGDLYVNNSDGGGDGTGLLTYVDAVSSLSLTAAGGGVSISSINTSTINGTNWSALVSTVIGLNGGPF
jgi:hypothetical protein